MPRINVYNDPIEDPDFFIEDDPKSDKWDKKQRRLQCNHPKNSKPKWKDQRVKKVAKFD